MRHRSDVEIVEAAVGGDPAAFEKLFDYYLPRVLAFARSAREGEQEAADLTRSILATVFAHLDRYEGRVALSVWALAVARKVRDATPTEASAPSTPAMPQAAR